MKKMVLFVCSLLLLAPLSVSAKNNKNKNKNKALPPGLQKKVERGDELPPGWQKKIAKGRKLDDTIYFKLEVAPRRIVKILPPPPPGVSFKKIEDKIVKINDINRQILEVLEIDRLPLPPLP